MKKYFYEKPDIILDDKKFNPYFEELLHMSENEFEQWVVEFRKFITQAWDEHNSPPKLGQTEDQIINNFNLIESFEISKLVAKDEETQEEDVIRNLYPKISSGVNQWFPTMAKTKINYGTSGLGRSIYDYVSSDELLESYTTMAKRVFRKDSFYGFSQVVRKNSKDYLFNTDSATDWISQFESKRSLYDNEYDYWIQEKDSSKINIETGNSYTGYHLDLKNDIMLILKSNDLLDIWCSVPRQCKSTIQQSNISDDSIYLIRLYKKKQRIFPSLFKSFKVCLCQSPVNFPPLVAKFLYQHYTNDLKEQDRILIWDPSCGWGGRLLGAMGVKSDRNIHYIGCDPNTDFNLPDGRLIYDDIAQFYNTKTYRGYGFFPHNNTYEIYQCGSEDMQHKPEFQKYKGKLDFVFTSPPYFNREQYSEDDEQSYKKFDNYDKWRDEFLYETLKTAVEWLRSGRYLAWNVADVKVGDNLFLPIETDSIRILKQLGMEHIKTWKMALAQMPGSNRTDDANNVTAKNSCKVGGVLLKYEPIFIWKKIK